MRTFTNFDCGRTCVRGHECKFAPITRAIGRTYVHSHTTKVAIEIRSREALAAAVLAMGGSVLGYGTHKLYSSTETGFAVQLPGWRYPVIAKDVGGLAYDNYNGSWGNAADLTKLTGRYAIEAARAAANGQGWMSQDAADGGLVVFHPSGGMMSVSPAGVVDATGFTGTACAEAGAIIEGALGKNLETNLKPAFFEERARITIGGGEE